MKLNFMRIFSILKFKPFVSRVNKYLFEKKRISILTEICNLFSTLECHECHYKKVLIDGMWDNANYWYRLRLAWVSLGLSKAYTVGLIGEHSKSRARNSLKAFGVKNIINIAEFMFDKKRYYQTAKKILENLSSSKELLNVTFHCNFPASIIYDSILKRQRKPTVDISDPNLINILAESIGYIYAAETILKNNDYDLIILSHMVDFRYATLAYLGAKYNKKVIVLYGDYGVNRFIKISHPADIFSFPGRPSSHDLKESSPQKEIALEKVGSEYLNKRFSGLTNDIGSKYAYQLRVNTVSRVDLCQSFGWDEDKKIIGVFNSNWFDYPHGSGLEEFSDFYDWINTTLDVAKNANSVNWLFKSHPCDEWYSVPESASLENILKKINLNHIKMVDKKINGLDLIKVIDYVVTCHGTIGLEGAALQKPILLPYAGWYGHAEFSRMSKNKEEYVKLLSEKWWDDIDLASASKKAKIFTGWTFGMPSWQAKYRLNDDSQQDKIYNNIIEFIKENISEITFEISLISSWAEHESKYFHIYKMQNSENYVS